MNDKFLYIYRLVFFSQSIINILISTCIWNFCICSVILWGFHVPRYVSGQSPELSEQSTAGLWNCGERRGITSARFVGVSGLGGGWGFNPLVK